MRSPMLPALPLLLAAWFSPATMAASANALPSCYAALKQGASQPATEVFVLIDQTTPLDRNLQQMVATNLGNFLTAGHAFSVLQFSAFTQGKYAQVVTSAALDGELPAAERNAVNKTQLGKFDSCMKQQPKLATQLATQALQAAFGGTSGDVAKSDILASLKDISAAVRQSAAPRRIVIIASDMLENSTITSFYANNAVRKIDPAKEMSLVNAARSTGDFGGAKVYVLGAGILSNPKQAQNYRDPKTLNALGDFWHEWFAKSNAELVEFGTPALLNPVR